MKTKLILAQGAEAIILKSNNKVIKERVKKSYRLPVLDLKLRKQRTKKETRLLEKSSKLIPVPNVYSCSEFNIDMDFIHGKKLSQTLDKLKNKSQVCKLIGENLSKLHDHGIIHGDLTTSNMIFSQNKVYFIDFGLGYESGNVEDKAVDLHLIKQALEAKHHKFAAVFFKQVLSGYSLSKNSLSVIKRLESVEKRGRYKQSY